MPRPKGSKNKPKAFKRVHVSTGANWRQVQPNKNQQIEILRQENRELREKNAILSAQIDVFDRFTTLLLRS